MARIFDSQNLHTFGDVTNSNAREFMQYRSPVGLGPSSKTCPKCEPQFAHITSVLVMPMLVSVTFLIAFLSAISQKAGHPVPESNLSSELNNGSPVAALK